MTEGIKRLIKNETRNPIMKFLTESTAKLPFFHRELANGRAPAAISSPSDSPFRLLFSPVHLVLQASDLSASSFVPFNRPNSYRSAINRRTRRIRPVVWEPDGRDDSLCTPPESGHLAAHRDREIAPSVNLINSGLADNRVSASTDR